MHRTREAICEQEGTRPGVAKSKKRPVRPSRLSAKSLDTVKASAPSRMQELYSGRRRKMRGYRSNREYDSLKVGLRPPIHDVRMPRPQARASAYHFSRSQELLCMTSPRFDRHVSNTNHAAYSYNTQMCPGSMQAPISNTVPDFPRLPRPDDLAQAMSPRVHHRVFRCP